MPDAQGGPQVHQGERLLCRRGRYVWEGKGKAAFLVVHFEGKCAGGAALYYDNGDAYAWIDGKILWA